MSASVFLDIFTILRYFLYIIAFTSVSLLIVSIVAKLLCLLYHFTSLGCCKCY